MDSTKPSLARTLGLFPATNIVIANMIGAGIFTTSGLLMAGLHNPLLMIGLWIVGGIIAFAGAMCYSELGAAIPEAGGEYTFLSRLFHPLLGFLSGWVSFIVGFSAPIAASAIGFSSYLFAAGPGWFEWTYVSVDTAKKIIAIIVILVFTAVHLGGISSGARVQNYLTVLKVLLLLLLVGTGFTIGVGDWGHFEVAVDTQPIHFKSMGLSLMWIMFAYSGWNASVYVGSEITNPMKNIPRSLLAGTGIVMLLYVLVNALFVYAVSPPAMEGVVAIGALAAGNLFGPVIMRVFTLVIAFALLSSISAFIILGPRVYYAMASDGRFFRFAARLGRKSKVPVYSIIFQAIVSSTIILSGTLDQIFTYAGFSLGIFPLFVVFALFRVRRSGKGQVKLPGYPFTPLLYLAAGLAILILTYMERPVESSIAVGTMLLGIPAYYLFRKR